MKPFHLSFCALILVALLAACVPVAPTANESATDATAAPTASAAVREGATRTITDDLGRTVEIPSAPQRVLFADEEHASMVTSLDYVPYAMGWIYDEDFVSTLQGIGGDVGDLSSVINIGNRNEPNIEKIAAVKPDLIIWWDNEEVVGQLEAIAPTLGLNPRHDAGGGYGKGPGEPRYSKQRIYAALVGVEDKLDAQLAEYEALLADVKVRHANLLADLEWTFMDTGDDFQPAMYDHVRFATFAYNAVLIDLGMTPSAAMTEAGEQGLGYDENFGYAKISPEVAPDYAADLLFIGRYDDAPINDQLLTVLSNTAAAQNDQIYRVDSNIWTYHLVQAEINVLRQIDEILSGGVENLGDFD